MTRYLDEQTWTLKANSLTSPLTLTVTVQHQPLKSIQVAQLSQRKQIVLYAVHGLPAVKTVIVFSSV